MDAAADETDKAVEKTLTASGMTVTGDDVEAVARSLARIETAAVILLHPLSFDETEERFYRLIEGDAAEDAA